MDETAPKTRSRSRAAANGSDPMGKEGEGATTPPPAPEPPTPKKRTPQDKKLHEGISGSYQMLGMAIAGVGMRIADNGVTGSGLATVEAADGLADAWMDLADKSPKIKAALRKFTEASAASMLIAAHVPILTPLLIDRGIVPGSNPEWVPPQPPQQV